VFEKRLKRCRTKLKLLTFLAIAVPAIVGGLALSYGVGWSALPILIVIGSALGVVQLTISIWAAVSGWQEQSEFLAVSVAENHGLASSFQSLGKQGPQGDEPAFTSNLGKLTATDDARRRQDNRFPLSEKETRRGMRAGLRLYQRPCTACKTVPSDMNATDCGVCGNF
jgi:mobilome CxxCx(11)CxxC protein